jgi:hypothetical protein
MKTKSAMALVGVLTVSALSISLARADDSCADHAADHAAEIAALKQRVAELERRLDPVPTVTLGPIVRNTDGSVRRMTQREAVSYCATRGGLPTAKQLALALNARGVSYTAREGFDERSPKNEPAFYYNDRLYERPTGDEGREFFWSSSIYNGFNGWAFQGNYGDVIIDGRWDSHAVRCAGR